MQRRLGVHHVIRSMMGTYHNRSMIGTTMICILWLHMQRRLGAPVHHVIRSMIGTYAADRSQGGWLHDGCRCRDLDFSGRTAWLAAWYHRWFLTQRRLRPGSGTRAPVRGTAPHRIAPCRGELGYRKPWEPQNFLKEG
eukprot:jgi/Botrbrau1/1313/Bobra.0063s0029.1